MTKTAKKLNAPTAEHVAYWAARGWRHKGLGLFIKTETFRGQTNTFRGRLHVYADGSTGIRVLDLCAISDIIK